MCRINSSDNDEEHGETETTLCSKRWMLFCMGVWFGVMAYMLNSNMSVAIVSMNRQQSIQVEDYQHQASTLASFTILSSRSLSYSNASTDGYPAPNPNIENEPVHYKWNGSTPSYKDLDKRNSDKCRKHVRNNFPYKLGEFTWTKRTQSFVLSGYYYGYMMSQIPGGWLSERFGGKHVIGTCIGITSTLTLLIPAMARTSAYMVVVARVLMGLSTGASTPGWYMLTGVWALPHERSRFSGAIWFGSVFGIVLGYSSAGFLCAHGFDNGWASVFYVHGLIGYLFVACWLYIVYSSPKQHPRISEAERKLLEGNIHIPIEKQANGIYSSLPFLTMMVAITLAATLADLIRSKQFLKVTTIRKLFQVTGLLGVAAFVLIPGYLDCSLREIVIVCLCLCTFFESVGCVGGHTCVAVDISPRYASIIFGISNAIASIPGILAPLMVAELTKNQTSAEWRIVFYIAAAVSVFAAVIFGVFASSELAPWEERKKTDVQIPLKESNG
ncbi:uncharacterized transporter slc-17.2-like isoform X2 [Mercenaria mercenaria]|uniref:uncharacterized transporter slc-17.2-like isoform X2 n=1 Tax=Mercenaria mercenaria TaxID=6596 RepID=UPI00234EBCA2|nr:uncharacterized transporter slc-17.2-like isoform X2 [Mercenaria mercenaria]